MGEGRVQQIATPQEAYLNPRNRFVAEFLGTANMFEAQVELGSGGARLVMADGTRLPAPKTGIETGAPVLAAVRPERIQIRQARTDGAAGPPAVIQDMVYLGPAPRSHMRQPAGAAVAALSLCPGVRHTPGDPRALA